MLVFLVRDRPDFRVGSSASVAVTLVVRSQPYKVAGQSAHAHTRAPPKFEVIFADGHGAGIADYRGSRPVRRTQGLRSLRLRLIRTRGGRRMGESKGFSCDFVAQRSAQGATVSIESAGDSPLRYFASSSHTGSIPWD